MAFVSIPLLVRSRGISPSEVLTSVLWAHTQSSRLMKWECGGCFSLPPLLLKKHTITYIDLVIQQIVSLPFSDPGMYWSALLCCSTPDQDKRRNEVFATTFQVVGLLSLSACNCSAAPFTPILELAWELLMAFQKPADFLPSPVWVLEAGTVLAGALQFTFCNLDSLLIIRRTYRF